MSKYPHHSAFPPSAEPFLEKYLRYLWREAFLPLGSNMDSPSSSWSILLGPVFIGG